jgi:hypothetical protein
LDADGRIVPMSRFETRLPVSAIDLELRPSSLSDWSLADRGMERRFALRQPATGW